MEFVYSLPFTVLEIPNIRLKKPTWLQRPSAMAVFSVVLLSYFLVTGGIIYDIIVEPPSLGSTTDEHGHSRPIAFLPYRVNGQYIMEGLASSFLFSLGGIGFIILHRTIDVDIKTMPKLNHHILLSIGILCVIIPFIAIFIFMRMKLPGYMRA